MGKKRMILLAFLLLLSISLLKYIFYFHLNPSDDDFTNVNLCPACYGSNLCPQFSHGDISLIGSSKLKYLQLLNRKNVYTGKLQNERVILKKLAHNWEIDAGDAFLCKLSNFSNSCSVNEAMKFLIKLRTNVENEDFFSNTLTNFNASTDITRCPSERLLSYIFNKMNLEQTEFSDHIRNKRIGEMLYSILVNPEAIILQAFTQNEGWPFPIYRGACGRIIVEEYVGKSLAYFEDAAWELRLSLSYQLLQISQLLTDNPLGFALYMTDVTMDNFAVKPDGTLLLIDLENIVIVDRWKIKEDKKPRWNETHISRGEACKDCLNFSFEDLCSYEVSDHNYYAICKGLLIPGSYYSSKGLLHHIPPNIEAKTRLSVLLKECADPTKKSGRFHIVPKLLQVMKSLL